MHPAIPIAAGLAAAYFFLFRKKEGPVFTPEQRAAGMTQLADLLFKVITKKGTPAERNIWAGQAVKLAAEMFGLTKTATGIQTGRGLPTDEVWPGTAMSVSAYMAAYTERQKPKALAAAQKRPVYNDEVPVPPFDDPRAIRARAVGMEKSNPSMAKILHTQADTLNTMIRAVKAKNTALGIGKGLLAAIRR